MRNMKAIVYSQTGDPSVLHLVTRKATIPGPGEVRVRVVISAVNPTDWRSRRGSHAGESLAFPEVVPNQDGAGIVDAVGRGVDRLQVGDRVWLSRAAYQVARGGTAQEFVVLPIDRVHPLADASSFELGASLGVPAITAHLALTSSENGPVRLVPGVFAGKTILIAGGAGAVGHAAIQLARWAGAITIATVSTSAKAVLASAAGAHHVVNYREPNTAQGIRRIAPDGVDLIVEVAPAVNAELNLAVIRNHGSIAIYANDGGNTLNLDVRAHFSLNVVYRFLYLYTIGQQAQDAAIADITRALSEGALSVGTDAGLPLHRFDLAHTADAHTAVERSAVGKVIIDLD